MTPNMQGIIMAIGKSSSVYEKSGPEAAFFKVQPLSAPLHFTLTHFLHLLLPDTDSFLVFSCACNIEPQTSAVFPTDFLCKQGLLVSSCH